MVQNALSSHGISHIRIDGKVSIQSRRLQLDQFRNEQDIRVALLTIDCGAVGYVLDC